MTKLTISLFALVFLASAVCAEAKMSEQEPSRLVVRIGTYDSRAIAIAFVGSEIFNQLMTDLKSRHDLAKATGSTKVMATLEAEATARQETLHKQAFSTEPVNNILKHIANRLTNIKEQAKVSIILSKWDRQALGKHKTLEQVDVTMLLIEAFKPNNRQKMRAVEIQRHDPVPLKKMETLKH